MKTIQKILTALGMAAIAMSALAVPASASSVEDVYAAMRDIGLPETMVQEAKVQYQNTPHDENGMSINGTYYTYDVWADMVYILQDQIWEKIGGQFDVPGKDIASATTVTTTTTTAPAPGSSQTTLTTTTTAVQSDPEKPFIQMTLDEKKAYVASLPENERAAFLAGLSNAERNSIIKQMDPGSQADLAQSFISLGEQLGMHVSVDDIHGGDISYSIRDGEGMLIDSAGLGGASVDDTGWDLTIPVLLSAGTVLMSLTGILFLALQNGKKKEEPCNE